MMRSHSEKFGLIGLEPLALNTKITSIQPKEDTNRVPIPSKNEGTASKNAPTALSTIPTAIRPLFMPPLEPTFGVCPQPYWLRTDVSIPSKNEGTASKNTPTAL